MSPNAGDPSPGGSDSGQDSGHEAAFEGTRRFEPSPMDGTRRFEPAPMEGTRRFAPMPEGDIAGGEAAGDDPEAPARQDESEGEPKVFRTQRIFVGDEFSPSARVEQASPGGPPVEHTEDEPGGFSEELSEDTAEFPIPEPAAEGADDQLDSTEDEPDEELAVRQDAFSATQRVPETVFGPGPDSGPLSYEVEVEPPPEPYSLRPKGVDQSTESLVELEEKVKSRGWTWIWASAGAALGAVVGFVVYILPEIMRR